MNKPKNYKTWRIVGIVVTALLIIGGFVGAYAVGVNRGALMDSDDVWMNPAQRMGRTGEDGEGNYRMPMTGYSRGYHSPIGGIFGFLIFLVVIGAFLRLIFFPMRMARYALFGRTYDRFHRGFPRHPHFHGDGPSCDEDCDEEPQQKSESAEDSEK